MGSGRDSGNGESTAAPPRSVVGTVAAGIRRWKLAGRYMCIFCDASIRVAPDVLYRRSPGTAGSLRSQQRKGIRSMGEYEKARELGRSRPRNRFSLEELHIPGAVDWNDGPCLPRDSGSVSHLSNEAMGIQRVTEFAVDRIYHGGCAGGRDLLWIPVRSLRPAQSYDDRACGRDSDYSPVGAVWVHCPVPGGAAANGSYVRRRVPDAVHGSGSLGRNTRPSG